MILQRDNETYAIIPHIPLGLVTPEFLQKLSEVAKKYEVKALKITSATRIALIGVKKEDIEKIWQDLGLKPGGMYVRIKVCPGNTFCRFGQQDAFGLCAEIDKRFQKRDLPFKFKIAVSGCSFDCAETCIKDLGFVGKPKGWTVTVGGCGGARPLLARKLVENVSTEKALELAEKIINFYEKNGKKKERLGWLIDRIGWEEFCKEIL